MDHKRSLENTCQVKMNHDHFFFWMSCSKLSQPVPGVVLRVLVLKFMTKFFKNELADSCTCE